MFFSLLSTDLHRFAVLGSIDPFSYIKDIKGPFALAAFAIAIIGFYVAGRLKPEDRTSKLILFGLATLMLVIALVTIVINRPIPTTEPYRVHVLALDDNHQPLHDVKVEFTTDIPGIQAEVTGSGTEFTINPSQMPTDGRFTIYARAPASFLTGQQSVVLGADHNPTSTISMTRNTSPLVRGYVEARGQRIPQATVLVSGFEKEAVSTDSNGGFTLPAHAAVGQTIAIHADAAGYPPLEIHWVVSDVPVSLDLIQH